LTGGAVSPERVANALASKQLLLVLDNCEHLVGAAASMAEALLRANPEARMIATSREPLRAEGECLYRVPPLAVPTEGSQDAEDPLRYDAVRLFVARALAAEPQFSPDGRVAAAIAAICRHLGRIPLAIELAAARMKSLVAADLGGAKGRYRLLETTRAYALEKLTQSGEFEQVARRHAEYCRDLFERAEVELQTRPTSEWLATYGRRIDNLRAALDWAFSPGGDASIGVALTAAAVPLWMHLSLMEECTGRVERALVAIAGRAGRDARCEMQLHAALAVSLMYTRGAVPEVGA